jgi:hypothetical protein
MFQDQSVKVREAIAWVFSKICEHHAEVLANTATIDTIIPLFIEKLSDNPKVSNQICRAIEHLSNSIGNTYGGH